MFFKQQRYSNYLDNKIISESSWLLQASNSKGKIYDNLRKRFIEPHPYPFLIEDAFKVEMMSALGKRKMSEVLAKDEEGGLTECIFAEKTELNVLYSFCINPEVKVMFKKRKIDRETGEVEESDFENDMEKAINLHVRYTKEVAWLINEKTRAVAECDYPDELGVLVESLQEAKSRLLGNSPDNKNWRYFLNYPLD